MKKLLFQPFQYIAGWGALAAGVAVIIITGIFGWLGRLHLDGVVDVHFADASPLVFFLAEGLVNWLSLALMLLIAGKIVSQTAFRAVDVFGTTALARWPFLLIVLTGLAIPFEKVGQYIEYEVLQRGEPVSLTTGEFVLFGAHALFIVLAVVWSMVLSYHGYSISCNVSKTRGVVSFLAALVLAEVLSKLALWFLQTQFLSQ